MAHVALLLFVSVILNGVKLKLIDCLQLQIWTGRPLTLIQFLLMLPWIYPLWGLF